MEKPNLESQQNIPKKGEENLDPEKVSGMTVTQIYEKVSDAFDDTDSKIDYLREMRDNIGWQKPKLVIEETKKSIKTVMDILGYEKEAKNLIQKGRMYNGAIEYENAYELSGNEKHRKKALEIYKEEAEKDSKAGRFTLAQSSYKRALNLDSESMNLLKGLKSSYENSLISDLKDPKNSKGGPVRSSYERHKKVNDAINIEINREIMNISRKIKNLEKKKNNK